MMPIVWQHDLISQIFPLKQTKAMQNYKIRPDILCSLMRITV